MKPNEIKARMNGNGSVHYLAFSEFRIKGSEVIVTLLEKTGLADRVLLSVVGVLITNIAKRKRNGPVSSSRVEC